MSKATQKFVEKCKCCFEEADKDKSGALKPAELKELIGKLSDPATAEEIWLSMFADLDDDGDKMITWEEFSEVCMCRDPKSVKKHELKELFKTLDKDGSGRLTKDEICQALDELELGADAGQSIEALDEDGDGKISCDEFLQVFG